MLPLWQVRHARGYPRLLFAEVSVVEKTCPARVRGLKGSVLGF